MEHCLSDILEDITSVIADFCEKLETISVFEYLFREMPAEIFCYSVSMQFIDDSHLRI
jgi:hypothetical protein